ncbi:alpha/beta hydrolase [Amycolatopsis suaedae]|uniref:Esterase family protein n=1 Tax=Amycolatopsis suaedae TaxID=2510978 RepID=A0A4Q7JC91_9PSEU|nr:alpha/beta hydrolase family protein [Amycolatopsis suaedae]RZQ63914.1 esterase family protein [Amycolatopsis suaedae]
MRARVLAVLLTVLALLAGLLAAAPASATGDRATVVSERMVGDRLLELVVRSDALRAEVGVRLLLPQGWRARQGHRWPTLYLLHGCCGQKGGGHRDWTEKTDVAEHTRDLDALIVMPDGGQAGFYSDWLDGPAWETFHLTELRRLLERRYRSGPARAVAGLSMGGFGALSYAARHPGMFRAAASYSGVVHTTYQGPRTTDALRQIVRNFGADPDGLWGDPVADARIWAAHNPFDLARRLRGIPVYLSTGDGRPGPLDPSGSGHDGLEQLLGEQAVALAHRLDQVGVRVVTSFYGPGRHTWPYWERELHRSLPMLMRSIGVPINQ